jgi:hypothetical protein
MWMNALRMSFRIRIWQWAPAWGNSRCWVTTKGTGDIETVFSTFLGQKVLGAICVRYSGSARPLQRPFQEGGVPPESDGANTQDGQIQLSSQAPGTFELHLAYQRHEYALPGNPQVEETVFVPSITTPMQAHEHLKMASPVIYQVIRLQSRAAQTARLRVYDYAQLQGATPADVTATYDPTLGQGALVARNQSHPDWARLFGVSRLQVRVSRWETGFDGGSQANAVLVSGWRKPPCRSKQAAIGCCASGNRARKVARQLQATCLGTARIGTWQRPSALCLSAIVPPGADHTTRRHFCAFSATSTRGPRKPDLKRAGAERRTSWIVRGQDNGTGCVKRASR